MKNHFFILAAFFVYGISFCQTIYDDDGTISYDRNVSLKDNYLNFQSSSPNGNLFINGTTGQVGIGSNMPYSNFDVKGGLPNGTIFSTSDERYEKSTVLNIGSYVNNENKRRMLTFLDIPQSNFNPQPIVSLAIEDRGDYNRFRFSARTGGDTWFTINNRLQENIYTLSEQNDNVKLILTKPDSYIGIGTDSFLDSSDIYRLSVNGAIRAHRVRVYTTWADFVFEKGYKLPTLDEVEKHIYEKGHLIDIPSALEVENNGIELGEMNKKLLQKVEELTLYIIEMNKELRFLKEQVNKK